MLISNHPSAASVTHMATRLKAATMRWWTMRTGSLSALIQSETRCDVERMFKKEWEAYGTLLKDRKDQEAEIDAYRDLIRKATSSDALTETDRDHLCVAHEVKRAKLVQCYARVSNMISGVEHLGTCGQEDKPVFNEITERSSRVMQIANRAGTRSDRGASRDSGHRMQSETLELLLPLRGDATLERTSDVDAPVSRTI